MFTKLYVVAQSAVPNPPPRMPPGLDGFLSDGVAWAKGIAIVAGVIGLIICGVMMMVGRRNRSATAVDGAAGVPWVLGGLFVVSAAATIVGAVI
jgi:hypothetical protein